MLYAAIGHEVERGGLDSVSRRAVVPAGRKLRLLGHVARASLRRPPTDAAPPLEATRFLVDAVVASRLPVPEEALAPTTAARWDPGARLAFLIDLFERLEQRDAVQAGDGGA